MTKRNLTESKSNQWLKSFFINDSLKIEFQKVRDKTIV